MAEKVEWEEISMKKFMVLVLALCLVLMGIPALADDTVYKVGVCQQLQHPALDQATQGFKDALEAKLGDKVDIVVSNASNDKNLCATIANQFVSDDVDLIMANATDALKACFSATMDIPVLGTSITEYSVALDLDSATFTGVTGMNVSGTSDLAPLNEQAAMIKEWFPEAKTVGLLYCSAEANSLYQVREIAKFLTEMGIESKEYAFTDSNDIAAVAQQAIANDVIYIPTDNTAAAYTETIANVVIPAGVPVIAGEEGICSGCGVATLTISYYDIGYKTGEMAYDILVNGAKVEEMPIQYAPQFTKKYNAANVEALKLTVPEGYVAIGE